MAELILQNLDEEILERLRQTAAEHGTTAEEEAKSILSSAIGRSSKLKALEWARSIRQRNAHLQKTNTLDLLREARENR